MTLTDGTPQYILRASALGEGLCAIAGPVSVADIEHLLITVHDLLEQWGVPAGQRTVRLDLVQRGARGTVAEVTYVVGGQELACVRSYAPLAYEAAATFSRFGMGAGVVQGDAA